MRRQLGNAQIVENDLLQLVKYYSDDSRLFDVVLRSEVMGWGCIVVEWFGRKDAVLGCKILPLLYCWDSCLLILLNITLDRITLLISLRLLVNITLDRITLLISLRLLVNITLDRITLLISLRLLVNITLDRITLLISLRLLVNITLDRITLLISLRLLVNITLDRITLLISLRLLVNITLDRVTLLISLRLLVNLTLPAIHCFKYEVPKDKSVRHYYLEVEGHLQSYKEAFADDDFFAMLTQQLGDLLKNVIACQS